MKSYGGRELVGTLNLSNVTATAAMLEAEYVPTWCHVVSSRVVSCRLVSCRLVSSVCVWMRACVEVWSGAIVPWSACDPALHGSQARYKPRGDGGLAEAVEPSREVLTDREVRDVVVLFLCLSVTRAVSEHSNYR